MTWFNKAVSWFLDHWQWIVLPVGLFLWVKHRFFTKPLEVVAPELSEADKVQQEVSDKTTQEILEAEALRDAKITKIEDEHRQEQDVLIAQQKAEAEAYETSPEELNEYMHSIGRKTRS